MYFLFFGLSLNIYFKSGTETGVAKVDKASFNNDMVSAARQITTLEMKELNERHRAEHAQKMYEHMRISFRQVEERNAELESKFADVRDFVSTVMR